MEGTLIGTVPDLLVVPTALFITVVLPIMLGLGINGGRLFVHIAANYAQDRTFYPYKPTDAGQPQWLVAISLAAFAADGAAAVIASAAFLTYAILNR